MKGGLIFALLVVLPSILITSAQEDASYPPTPSASAEKQVYIVYLSDKPPTGVEPKAYYTKILSPVLGSEKAANDAIIYTYGIIPGFAVKLNPDQASHLEEQAGVVYVIRDIKYQLDDHINA